MNKATIYLVGAGPGDPGLITVKGLDLIKRADCVIYDGLANPAMLGHARKDAELISVAKRSGHHSVKQPEINALIVEKAKQHRTIVRLKGGDPCLFGRAAEEIKACIEAGICFEIVPGITSGAASAEYAGIFLTDRDHTSAVCFVTGHEAEGKEHTDIDWDNLAGFNGSIVIYMGMGNLEKIAATLIVKGKSADTPAAVIHKATHPGQRLVKATLEHIADVCQDESIAAPSIIVIGPAAAGMDGANWFMGHPLFGKRVLMTRDAKGNRIFADKLAACGAEPIAFDSIEVQDVSHSEATQMALQNLSSYDWAIFTSANGVTHTFSALDQMKKDARGFGNANIACIGRQTADKLKEYGIVADFIPTKFTSLALATELTDKEDLRGQKILLLRSAIAPNDLPAQLTQSGGTVTDAHVYTVGRNEVDFDDLSRIQQQITDGAIDFITFTSSSTVDSFFSQIPPEVVESSNAQIVSIGPATTKTLDAMDIRCDIEAKRHTVDGIIEILMEIQDD
ncbi:MAG: uroporphyrinogen-III C-methyltransferase [Planctomycetota bacterium]|jgi:uroporphyrinogen III methyltransferase/synthase